VLQSLAILRSDRHGALDGLPVHVQGNALAAALVELDIDGLALIKVIEDDVDIDRGGEEEGRHRVQR
jgi:hypothetical protein